MDDNILPAGDLNAVQRPAGSWPAKPRWFDIEISIRRTYRRTNKSVAAEQLSIRNEDERTSIVLYLVTPPDNVSCLLQVGVS